MRVRKRVSVASITLLLALTATGCSHNAPYYGSADRVSDATFAPGDDVRQRVLLIGDSGKPKMTGCGDKESCEPILEVLEHWAKKPVGAGRPFIVFLGDNIYPGGLPDESNARKREQAEAKLRAQSNVLINSEARGTFVPGNHDWGGTFGRYHQLWMNQYEFLKQAESLQKAKYGRSHLLVPEMESGCPWPVSIDEGELVGVTLIVLDSQWWLTPDKMEDVDACPRTGTEAIAAAQARVAADLADMLEAVGDNQVIVATHHPMASHGVHGASFRAFSQDLGNPKYQTLIKTIQQAYRESGVRPLIHAAGHDHALQVLKGADETHSGEVGAHYNLVSGAGSKAKLQSVWHGDDTLFAHQSTGFMVVDYMRNGDVFLQVIEPDGSNPDGERVFATQLK